MQDQNGEGRKPGGKPRFFKAPTVNTEDMIYGVHPVMEALESGRGVDKILIATGERNERINELMKLAKAREVPVQYVPKEKLMKVGGKTNQGVVCFVSPVNFMPLDKIIAAAFEAGREPFLVLLDRITDVRNFGAIVRTCECAGVDAVIVPAQGAARIGSDALKTSAGALNHMPVCREQNLKQTLTFLAESGIRLVACTEKAEKSVYGADMSGPVCLLMGSEETGVSPEYLRLCNEQISIPMFGKIGSLNVGVATGICLYEVVRRRVG